MNSEIRANAFRKLAKRYGIDPEGRDPILRYVAVMKQVVEGEPDGPLPEWFELHEYPNLWEPVIYAEDFCDHDGMGILVGVVDLEAWEILQRSPSGWASFALPE